MSDKVSQCRLAGEMVERVALALTREGFPDAVIPLEMHRRWARIAIAAMREPTEAMVDAVLSEEVKA